MIKKRLIGLLKESKKYIVQNVREVGNFAGCDDLV